MPEPKTLDMEALKNKSVLTEDEQALIANEAYEEQDKEKAGKQATEKAAEEEASTKKEKEEKEAKEAKEKEEGKEKETKEEQPKSDEELLKAPDEELKDEEKAKKKELLDSKKEAEEAEEKRLIEAKDEDLSDEEKTRKAEVVKARADADKKTHEEKVKAYAEEHSVSEEDATTDLESMQQMIDEAGGDPNKLAKSYLHLRRLQGQTTNELKKAQTAIQAAQEITPQIVIDKFIDKGLIKINGKPASREQVVEAYKEQNPDTTENASEDAVLKMAAKEIKVALDKKEEINTAQLVTQAKEKRSKLIGELSETDRQFLPAVKGMINNLSDAQIVADDFTLSPYINYAKGKDYDKAVKEAGEREYKRGLDEAKIIADKSIKKGAGDGTTKSKPADGLSREMTDREKTRALEMFDSLKDTSEVEKFKMYIDQYPKKDDEFKND